MQALHLFLHHFFLFASSSLAPLLGANCMYDRERALWVRNEWCTMSELKANGSAIMIIHIYEHCMVIIIVIGHKVVEEECGSKVRLRGSTQRNDPTGVLELDPRCNNHVTIYYLVLLLCSARVCVCAILSALLCGGVRWAPCRRHHHHRGGRDHTRRRQSTAAVALFAKLIFSFCFVCVRRAKRGPSKTIIRY